MSSILGPNSAGLPGKSDKRKKKAVILAILSKIKGSRSMGESGNRSDAARRMSDEP